MPAAQDIQSTDSGDLLIVDSDLSYGLSDPQHIEDTIVATPLSWKQYPSDGVAVLDYLGSSGKQQQLQKNIKQQLAIDGYSQITSETIITNDEFKVTPHAVRI